MAEESTHEHTHKEQRRQYTFNKLKGFGQEIIEDIEKNKVPTLRIPSRGTGNIVYDEDKRYYVLGDRYGRRSLGNVKQIRKLGQMVYVANFCKDLVLRDKTATIREMYYISEGWGGFKSIFSLRMTCPFLTSDPFCPMSCDGVTLVSISTSSSSRASFSWDL